MTLTTPTTTTRPWLRTLRWLTLCLLAGAITTILLAWSAALLTDARHGVVRHGLVTVGKDEYLRFIDVEGLLYRRRSVRSYLPSLGTNSTPGTRLMAPQWSLFAESMDNSEVHEVRQTRRASWRGAGPRDLAILYTAILARESDNYTRGTPVTIATGWPWLALECNVGWSVHPPPTYGIDPIVSGGILMPGGSDTDSALRIRVIPFRPTWPGFALNTVIAATIIALLAILTRLYRTLLRYRRGRCPHCAYDRTADYTRPCPECGHSALSRASNTT